MASIVSIDEIGHGKRRASYHGSRYNLALDAPEREWVHAYRVVTDDAQMDADSMLEAAWVSTAGQDGPLPNLWEQHPTDTDAYAVEFGIEETEHPKRWLVTVTYQLAPKPWEEPGVWRISGAQTERAIEEDVNGAALVNKAGDPFDPPITVPDGYTVLTCAQNFQTIDTADIEDNFKFHTNVAEFRGHAAGAVLLADWSAEPDFKNGLHYWRTTYTFHARTRGWNSKPLNAGFRQKLTLPVVGSQLVSIRDPSGQIVSSPALLDNTGAKLAVGGTPIFLDFQVFNSADFNQLGLTGRSG